ncbi:MAG: Uma2 family endonuclease [Phycisphaerae bacterium]
MVQRNYRPPIDVLDPSLNGVRMSRSEFERAELRDGYRFELIGGFLQVAPAPNPNEKDIAVELFELLREYTRSQTPRPFQRVLWEPRLMISSDEQDATNPEPDIAAYEAYSRSRVNSYDNLSLSLVVEVVSEGGEAKDYVRNRALYESVKTVREYWVVDPRQDASRPSMAVFRRAAPETPDSPFERFDIEPGGVCACETWPGLSVDLTKIGVKFS